MLSYQITDWGKPLEARTEDPPTPTGTEVLIRVSACGVCHSDLHIWDGFFDLGGGKQIKLADTGLVLPHTLGHEVVGEVVAVGPQAEGVALGDSRIVFPWIGCRDCPVCASGEEQLCLKPQFIGARVAGGYSDHVLVPDAKYLIDHGDLPTDLACIYACSGITAFGAVKKVLPLTPDDTLLIIGAGGVGLNAVQFATAMTDARIVVADTDPVKRKAALKAGAAEAIDNSAPGAAKQIFKLTGGVAASIDFVGAPATSQFGIDALRKAATHVVVGLYGGALPLSLPLLPMKAMTLRGSYVGSLTEMEEMMVLVRSGKISAIPIETRPLAEANTALTDLRAGKTLGRIILCP